MNEKQLERALKAAMPKPPEGFAERSEIQLNKLAAQEEKGMKRTGILILAAALLLMFSTTLAAGIIAARRGLDDSLQVDEATKQSFEGSDLFDEPNLSVTDNGVTVTLEECIADFHAAYLAFRVQGYTPEGDWQPDFDLIDSDFGVTSYSGGSSFYNWAGKEEPYREVWKDENGELLYIIQLVSFDDTIPGNTVKVSFTDLGVFKEKAKPEMGVKKKAKKKRRARRSR